MIDSWVIVNDGKVIARIINILLDRNLLEFEVCGICETKKVCKLLESITNDQSLTLHFRHTVNMSLSFLLNYIYKLEYDFSNFRDDNGDPFGVFIKLQGLIDMVG
jgi:hypothetical protein